MLIKCPECNNDISDKAVACPRCGFPMQPNKSTLATEKAVTSRPRRFRRLPNGFGSIKHLSGKRRNPYAAYPPTKEWSGTSPKARPAIGYFHTYNEAYQALAEYNKVGIDIEKKIVTFSQVYEIFLENYRAKNPSKQALASYTSAYDKCKDLYDIQFASLRKMDYQAVFDDYADYSVSTVNNLKKLFNQLYKTAIELDIVDRNYSSNAITKGRATEKGVPFTEDEISLLWEHRQDERIQPALIMIYCGYRVGELQTLSVKGNKAIGGLKTKAGKNRAVPIHPAVMPFIGCLDGISKSTYPGRFYEILGELGLSFAKTGERHTCHDCRHTFSWLADKYKMDGLAKRIIMGHSLGSDVEVNTYGHRTFEELEAEISKIKAPFCC